MPTTPNLPRARALGRRQAEQTLLRCLAAGAEPKEVGVSDWDVASPQRLPAPERRAAVFAAEERWEEILFERRRARLRQFAHRVVNLTAYAAALTALAYAALRLAGVPIP